MFYIIVLILIFHKILSNKKIRTKEKFNPYYKKTRFNLFNEMKYCKQKNCCLVTKKLDKKKGRFYYDYKKLKPCDCNPEKHIQINNKSILFSSNDFTNQFCKAKYSRLGSCRKLNHECIEFVVKDQCPKKDMDWSPLTCESNIYNLDLKSNLNKLPEYEDERTKKIYHLRKLLDESDNKYQKSAVSFASENSNSKKN
tara:strand:+ start:224 stop:814 length:591 start_codon:yes stop_codon:yes gene_type:complete